MRVVQVPGIPGAQRLCPERHEDPRGFFLEVFREDALADRFVQANHSHSKANVLRGLHYHHHQSDAWYVVAGHMQAMLADLRDRSARPAVASVDLVAEDPQVLYIPPGVAHGFLALSDCDLIYWVTNYYDGADEHGVAWNDPLLEAPWKTADPLLSDRDRLNPCLEWPLTGS